MLLRSLATPEAQLLGMEPFIDRCIDLVDSRASAFPLPSGSLAFAHGWAKRGDPAPAALIGVEDRWSSMAGQSFLQRLDAERGLHRDGHPPRQHNRAVENIMLRRCFY